MAASYAKKYMSEEFMEGMNATYELQNILYTGKSDIQSVDVLELTCYGRTLVIDGKIQSTVKDEFLYHEYLVHPILTAHPNPKTVMICGGGEGATAREILRHKSVEKVVMVDIDRIVIDVSRQYLPDHHRGSYDNPRFELVIQDARKYLEDYEGKFDIIIMDLSDPLEDGPAYRLYSTEFYQLALSKLTEHGLLASHSGPASWLAGAAISVPVNGSMKQAFKFPLTYTAHMPAYLDVYSFAVGTNSELARDNFLNWDRVDAQLEERIDARHEIGASPEDVGSKVLRAYDSETHRQMISLPKYYRKMLAEGDVWITDAAPRFYKPHSVACGKSAEAAV